DFAQTIDQTIAKCNAALVIIGPRWMEILRTRAGDNGRDYVRREIAGALARGITVIPVLVGGASIKDLADLPEDLKDLALHEAAELRDATFKADCTHLANALKKVARPARGKLL